MRALLDVNVLIALHDANHAHHAVATQWLIANIEQGWASCALTQNGCLRIMAQSGYSNPQPLPILVRMLQKSTQSGAHEFWGDGPSLLDVTRFQHAHIHSPRQLTDLYLLALAVGHQGRLVTFDQRIPLSAVHGASSQHLVVL
jgi:uncharacterized protein